MPSQRAQVLTLHRYYIWANLMRTHFDETLRRSPRLDVWSPESIDRTAYMSYWYAGLYVVVEGWRRLRLRDARIEELLKQPDMVRLLKQYRNAVFHFSTTYNDDRLIAFLKEGAESARWARFLNRAFGRYFPAYFQARS
jgi:hypothetical protein